MAACGDGSSQLPASFAATAKPDGGTGVAISDAGGATGADVGAGSAEPSPEDGASEAAGDEAAAPSSCASLPLCDGFETDAVGAVPAGWSVVMGCNPNTQDTAVDGGGLLVGVDSSQHHGGQRSLRIVGGDSCGFYAVQQSAFTKLGTQLYTRIWAMFSGGPTPNHNGFLAMPTTGSDHLRLGFQDNVLAWNAQTSDATLPDMDPEGTTRSAAPAAGTWTCIEFHVDETDGDIEFWMNGQSVAGLGWDGGSTQGVNDQWARGGPSPAVPTSLGLGWLGLNDQQIVWFDDVSLGDTRIGCN
jgi:hypothetical protein